MSEADHVAPDFADLQPPGWRWTGLTPLAPITNTLVRLHGPRLWRGPLVGMKWWCRPGERRASVML